APHRPPLRRRAAHRDPSALPRRSRDPRGRLHALGDARSAACPRRGARHGRRCRGDDCRRRRPPRPRRARGRRRSRRRLPPERSPVTTGEALRELRERKPLIHQITNYVVMNETANATLALGALPVMAHAAEEVEEMASIAGALVLNIGTLSRPWVEAMLLAGKAANKAGVPVVLDPVGAGATRFRTDTVKRILDEV